MNENEFVVLLNFLKSGFSTRQLDKLLGHKNSRGWKSWELLKKYKLRNQDKGKLFLYSTVQSKKIIITLSNSPETGKIDELLKNNLSSNLQKYHNTFVIAESEKKFYQIMSGETRNIIRDFFNPKKKLINRCQYNNCSFNGQIDTVHYTKDRPVIFIECAKVNKTSFSDDLFKFDVHATMRCFLKKHSNPKSVCFLCKKHHNEFHITEKISKKKLNEFKQNIEF